MSEPEASTTDATERSQYSHHEAVAAAVTAVVCCLCATGCWMCSSYNERAVAEARAKTEAVRVMVDAGRPQQEINQLLVYWNPPPSAGQSASDKRVELVRSLQQRNVSAAEIIKIVSLCYPEDAERPKPTADEKAKPDAERSKTEVHERPKASAEKLPQ
jgi:hypothetical protein